MNKKLFALLLVSAFALQLKAGEPSADSARAGEMHTVSDGDDDDDLGLGGSVEVVEDRGRAADQLSSSSSSREASPVEVVDPEGEEGSDDRSATRAGQQAATAALAAGAFGEDSASSTRGGESVRGRGRGGRRRGAVRPKHNGRPAAASACAEGCHVAREIPGKDTNVVVGLFNRFVRNGLWTPKMNSKDVKRVVHGAPLQMKDLTQDQMAVLEAAWENLNAERSRFGVWGSRGSKFGRAVFVGFVAKVVRDVMNETEDDEDEDEVVA